MKSSKNNYQRKKAVKKLRRKKQEWEMKEQTMKRVIDKEK